MSLPWSLQARDLPPGSSHVLKPQGDTTSYDFRSRQLERVFYRNRGDDFLSVEEILATYKDQQFGDENHRRLTPFIQNFVASGKNATKSIDTLISYNDARTAREPTWDVVIVGTGPHGVCAATTIRELNPTAKILMLESAEKVGGQFRWYGDKPAFYMNSRVRPASRVQPGLPGTPGNINPMGSYAPVQLSDFVTGNYATNVQIGEVIAWNAFLSADVILTRERAVTLTSDYVDTYDRTYYARKVIDARGIREGYGTQFDREDVLTATDFYKHFGSQRTPLQAFHDKKVCVIGGGDSALTVMEALLGALPCETYGPGGVGRLRPREIQWVGAPYTQARDVQSTLRCRYKNGIPQEIASGLITPYTSQTRRVFKRDLFYEVSLYDAEYLNPNIVVDCTTRSGGDGRYQNAVGGLFQSEQYDDTRERIGLDENSVSLWATIPETERIAGIIARSL